jgi:2-amino-4-hydroxy-6-hydroxymethyldihydropteridine diphosphokinase
VKRSALYETEPVGFRDQHFFLNGVVECETQLMPRQLVRAAQRIEREMGRRRNGTRKAPRNMDIDVLLFGTTVMRTAELQIPHPRIAERKFVLAPLAEIAPSLRLPVFQATAIELLAATSDRSQVRKLHS